MSPLKTKLHALAKDLCQQADRAEESAKTQALAHLRTPNSAAYRDEAMKADGRAEAYRHAMRIVDDAARSVD